MKLMTSPTKRFAAQALIGLQLLWPLQTLQADETALADAPIFQTTSVPPNLMLTLSVEWPTGVLVAYKTAYADSSRFLGYFDPESCYTYKKDLGATSYNTPDTPSTTSSGRNNAAAIKEYFVRTATGTGTNKHQCSSAFSGNYLNWAMMHGIDGFRFALTGGDRVIDTATNTVVEKARHDGQGGSAQSPNKLISSSVSTVAPFSGSKWSSLYSRVTNGSTELNPFSNNATRGRIFQISNNSDFTHDGSNKFTYTYMARVQVCADSANLEYGSTGDYEMCQQYPNGNYKPVGLIQKYASKIRFGATGYLKDDSSNRAGGVLRARMKYVGPEVVVPNGTNTANGQVEWNSSTGVYVTNPDTADASASGVSNSGVINYLNKFGKENGYKGYDPLSEMYYAAQLAMRNLPAVPGYVSGLTTAMKDGFPVISTTVDENDSTQRPIQYSCQKTNFVGIADANTHTDTYVPGNTMAPYSGHPTGAPSDPSGINVKTLDNKIGTLENYKPGSLGTFSRGRNNTYHIAGLAYWANTQDMLPDDNDKSWTVGKQQAKTYFVDVVENGGDTNGTITSGPCKVTTPIQMWMAAKYGGFDDKNSDGVPADQSTWDKNSDCIPDNYFTASQPDKLISALKSIFDNVVADAESAAAGATLSNIDFSSTYAGSGAYLVGFHPKYWTGYVKGYAIHYNEDSELELQEIWNAQTKLDAQATGTGWDTGRKIVTSKVDTYTSSEAEGIPFRLDSLSTTQKTYMNFTGATQQQLLNYLRGDESKEGTLFRTREHILGDIVDSEAAVVTTPNAKYSDIENPGYSTFKTKYSTTGTGKKIRKTMLYVGANDGMLHAFYGDVGNPWADPVVSPEANAGKELWAYIPSFVLSGPSSPATPTVDGIASRANINDFQHKYLVDQTPYVRDVDFARTGLKDLSTTARSALTPDWHTILVAGLNKGGRGYYALDITDPEEITTESLAATKVLWEFTDEDMGYSFGRPIIVKTARDGWVVIVASGYNNIHGSNTDNRGKGFLYVLNAKTGEVIQKIETKTGSETDPSGFSHPAAFVPRFADYTADFVYGGDLLGNLWRFDLTGRTPTTAADDWVAEYPVAKKFAELKDTVTSSEFPTGTPQPVTIEPKIEVASNGFDRWVFIGTGKLMDQSDMTDSQAQTFYALRDGNVNAVYDSTAAVSAPLPAGVTLPVNPRSKAVKLTSLLTGITTSLTKPMGWYYDLWTGQINSKDASEKITAALAANEGVIAWVGYRPSTDPCSPGAESYLYVTDYAKGKSKLFQNDVRVPYIKFENTMLKVQFVKDADGKIRLVTSSGSGTPTDTSLAYPGSMKSFNLNWQQILQ